MDTLALGHLREKQKEEARRLALAESSRMLFSDNQAQVLEIGCGHGHFLSDFAGAHPEESCIGIDLLNRRVTKAGNKKDKRDLSKLTFLKAEASEFLETLPENVRFSLIFILFPDPWPKKRHFRRRFIQAHSLDLLAKHSREGSRLCFRTDHQGYFDWTKEHIQAHALWKIETDAPWPFEAGSYFQSLMTDYLSFVAVRQPAR